MLWLLFLTTFLGYPQVQKDFPFLSYFCLPSPLFMRDTSSRTTSHTEFEYNITLQANDHTQNKLNDNTHLQYLTKYCWRCASVLAICKLKAVLALPQINKYIVNLCPFILVQLLVYSIDMNNLARYYITKPLKLEFDH